jgi:small subunit ribosomal protein S17
MADEEQNNHEENGQVEEMAEETVSAPEGPVAPAAEIEEPAAQEPAAEEPAAEEPVAEESATEEPAAEEPAAEEPAAEEPADEAPAEEAEAPAEEAPAAEAPSKKKRKRLPRSQRHRHSKPKRERPADRKAITRVSKPEHPRGRRQERRGVVVSSNMDKTIVVRVDAVKAHPKYQKVVRRSTKFHAHDEQNQAKVGDVVRIVETRPLSKTKNWRLAEIVEVAQ